jgi:hypothetical protein
MLLAGKVGKEAILIYFKMAAMAEKSQRTP